MPTITVKNIPADLYERLKQAARAHRRSINSEIIVYIERAVLAEKVDPEAIIARARKLRAKTVGSPIRNDELDHEKGAGRP